jgi:chemotaxis methyl-accepting protein methylase
LGSGPGRDVIDVLSGHYQSSSDVRVVNIDKDITALKRGKRLASIKKVDHLIDFVQENFLKYQPEKKFDIVVLIGVLCPLPSTACIEALKTIKGFLKDGGCLIASNVANKMKEEDPFACYIMDWVANWKFVYKEEEELKRVFEQAGFQWKRYLRDSYGFHVLGVGTPRP